jgi:TatD DNase family protein
LRLCLGAFALSFCRNANILQPTPYDYPDFAHELPDVVARAEAAGITKIISIGTDLESSQRAIQLAEQFPNVFAVVGWHPCDASRAPGDFRPALRDLARHPKIVALGETGLDYHRLPSQKATPTSPTSAGSPIAQALPTIPPLPFGRGEGRGKGSDSSADDHYKQKQADLFQQHLEIAAELGLNCVIHQRDAFEDTLAQLQPFATRVRGVFHCFANDSAVAPHSGLLCGQLHRHPYL